MTTIFISRDINFFEQIIRLSRYFEQTNPQLHWGIFYMNPDEDWFFRRRRFYHSTTRVDFACYDSNGMFWECGIVVNVSLESRDQTSDFGDLCTWIHECSWIRPALGYNCIQVAMCIPVHKYPSFKVCKYIQVPSVSKCSILSDPSAQQSLWYIWTVTIWLVVISHFLWYVSGFGHLDTFWPFRFLGTWIQSGTWIQILTWIHFDENLTVYSVNKL